MKWKLKYLGKPFWLQLTKPYCPSRSKTLPAILKIWGISRKAQGGNGVGSHGAVPADPLRLKVGGVSHPCLFFSALFCSFLANQLL